MMFINIVKTLGILYNIDGVGLWGSETFVVTA